MRALALFVLVSIAIFKVIKLGLISTDLSGSLVSEIIFLICSVLIFMVATPMRMSSLPSSMRILLLFIFGSFLLYCAFPLTLPYDIGLNFLSDARIRYRQFIIPVLMTLGFLRPGLGGLGLIWAMAERKTLGTWFGANLSATEFFPLAEVGLFLVAASLLSHWAKDRSWVRQASLQLDRNDQFDLLTKITLIGICFHLANYFYSGFQKLIVGNSPLSWMLYNHTENMIPVHLLYGQLPLTLVPGLPEWSFFVFGKMFILINAVILFGQLAAIFAVWKIRWIRNISGFFDLTHIGIFLVSGIFFYKWILLNIAIIVALGSLRGARVTKPLRSIMFASVLLAPAFFSIAHLAWWDVMSFNKEKIVAVLEDGQEFEVPTNFWGSFAVHYAQQRRSETMLDLLYPNRYGKDKDQRQAELANQCQLELPHLTALPPKIADIADPHQEIRRHIVIHHQYVLEHVDDDGRYYFNFYPHHIWSAFWNYKHFSELDMRKVAAYRFIGQAICVRWTHNQFASEIRREISFDIPLK